MSISPLSFPQPDILTLNLPALGLTGPEAVAPIRLRLGTEATLALAVLASVPSHLV